VRTSTSRTTRVSLSSSHRHRTPNPLHRLRMPAPRTPTAGAAPAAIHPRAETSASHVGRVPSRSHHGVWERAGRHGGSPARAPSPAPPISPASLHPHPHTNKRGEGRSADASCHRLGDTAPERRRSSTRTHPPRARRASRHRHPTRAASSSRCPHGPHASPACSAPTDCAQHLHQSNPPQRRYIGLASPGRRARASHSDLGKWVVRQEDSPALAPPTYRATIPTNKRRRRRKEGLVSPRSTSLERRRRCARLEDAG
jgi:hypothetical protein